MKRIHEHTLIKQELLSKGAKNIDSAIKININEDIEKFLPGNFRVTNENKYYYKPLSRPTLFGDGGWRLIAFTFPISFPYIYLKHKQLINYLKENKAFNRDSAVEPPFSVTDIPSNVELFKNSSGKVYYWLENE